MDDELRQMRYELDQRDAELNHVHAELNRLRGDQARQFETAQVRSVYRQTNDPT